MSYISGNLLNGEKVTFNGKRHWIVFLQPLFWLIVTAIFVYKAPLLRNLAFVTILIAIISGISATISYIMSEIGVINMRILIKVGLFSMHSSETMLQNISSIDVAQSFLGKVLGYGTVIICDRGTIRIPFENIEDPYGFRRKTQEEINRRYPPPVDNSKN